MSTLSRRTSSSSGHPSSSVGHPSLPFGPSSSSSSSSTSSTSSSSSTADSVSVGVAEAPPPVEVVRGDDPTHAVDRSGSPPTVIPLVEISSTYNTELSMTKFLAKYPVLKAAGTLGTPTTLVFCLAGQLRMCVWGGLVPVPSF